MGGPAVLAAERAASGNQQTEAAGKETINARLFTGLDRPSAEFLVVCSFAFCILHFRIPPLSSAKSGGCSCSTLQLAEWPFSALFIHQIKLLHLRVHNIYERSKRWLSSGFRKGTTPSRLIWSCAALRRRSSFTRRPSVPKKFAAHRGPMANRSCTPNSSSATRGFS